ncbi:MAG: sugar ABC transporter ATP-binding protein [Bacillota bacterium]|nr:sugar ABC transporter ATP-binding protein [Bacillota bacterium]
MTASPFLEMKGITKRFPGVVALQEVDFACRLGSVHALVGENGAGKSTLIKVLGGVYQPDAGEIRLDGRAVQINHPDRAARLGISVIHQELNLIPAFTVAQNIFLGHEPRGPLGSVDRRRAEEEARRLLDLVGVEVDPDDLVSELSLAQKQMVEIARALSRDSKVIVMDEPTAALNGNEVRKLLELIRQLAQQGRGIIFISHRLEEVFEVSQEITVLRDGRVVATRPAAECSMELVVRLMTGKEHATFRIPGRRPPGKAILELRAFSSGRYFQGVNLCVREGEIVGLIGLEGQGQREVLRALSGALPITGGQVLVDGRPCKIAAPRDAIRSGLAFVPEERKSEGLCLVRDVLENIALPTLRERQLGGFVRRREERRVVRRLVEMLRIQPPSLAQRTHNLSGGNQQKVVIAKWLAARPRVLLFSEPTRGVDVGAKEEIYQLMRQVTDQGGGVLMVSGDLGEVMRLCDRVLVMFEGRVVKEFPGDRLERQALMAAQWGMMRPREEGAADVP